MCGFLGVAAIGDSVISNYTEDYIKKDSDVLIKRGPDDRRIISYDKFLLKHYRLSIRGLGKGEGEQPLHNKNWCFGFNGEIYLNDEFQEIKEIGFKSDTKYLWHQIINNGVEDTLEKVIGEYAICVHNRKKNILYLVVDPQGVKPLYFSFNNGNVSFSSSLKDCFFALEGNKKEGLNIDFNQIGEYLIFRSFSGQDTGYKNISKIQPGELLSINLNNGDIKRKIVSSFNFKKENYYNFKKSILSFESFLDSYTQSDTPISLCLSGGLDSSTILYSLMRSGLNPECFFIDQGKEDPDFISCQEISSRNKNLKINFINCSENIWNIENFKKINDIFDGWVHLPNALLLDQVFKFASNDFKVMLSGEGADEIFSGYNRYQSLPSFIDQRRSNQNILINCFDNWPDYKLSYIQDIILSTSFSSRVIMLDACQFFDLDNGLNKRELVLKEYLGEDLCTFSTNQLMRFTDLFLYLPAMLRRQDTLSMNYSIECRVPFSSPLLDKIASNKINRSKMIGKKYLKNIASKINVPYKIINRKKYGFPANSKFYRNFIFSDEVKNIIMNKEISKNLFIFGEKFFYDNEKLKYSYIHEDFNFTILNLSLALNY